MIERTGWQLPSGLQFSENSLESSKAALFNDKIFVLNLQNGQNKTLFLARPPPVSTT
ncbi:hypothetical protein [Neolewinella aurantiaca]|uniref:hypothetical protein n=1 Tax=Neolewinella aurantiaca TaxID=2602767 RepID=UPI00164FB6CC|nr:hypothetical protein [Neolewinella aurantiaca]